MRAASAIDPAREGWAFWSDAAPAWQWVRRQAIEAAVHRWDAEQAIGEDGPIAPDLAEAGLAEVTELLYPRQVALGRTAGLSAPVTLEASDTGGTWRLGPAGEPAASVQGPAALVILAVWGRVDLDDERLRWVGEPGLAHEWRRARLTP